MPIGGCGFGITMMLEILAGVLTGGAVGTQLQELYGAPSQYQELGHLVLVIDPESFMSRAVFQDRMAFYIIDMIKASERARGSMRSSLPESPSTGATLNG